MIRNSIKMVTLLLLVAFMGVAYATVQETTTTFEISPNPMGQHTTVYLYMAQKLIITVTVETSAGTVLKTLYSGDLTAGAYQFYWDRYTDDGVYVPNGKYCVNVSYTSKYTSTKKTLILK